MSQRVDAAMRAQVIARAGQCCEYCGLADDVVLIKHQPDHIIATKHGGKTSLENLAYACYACNHQKGSDIASVDPLTGTIVRLYHPRQDLWADHFRWREWQIEPLTAIGRATATLLRFNDPQRIATRANLAHRGRFPFERLPEQP
jgi:hypothetical protein